MKNTILLTALVITMLLITACGTPEETPTTTEPTDVPVVEQTTEPAVEENIPEVETVTFNIKSANYKFWIERESGELYEESPDLVVKQGSKVIINLDVRAGYHDFVIDDFNVKTPKVDGPTQQKIEFIADKTGTFEYYCSIGQQRVYGMYGKLIVE